MEKNISRCSWTIQRCQRFLAWASLESQLESNIQANVERMPRFSKKENVWLNLKKKVKGNKFSYKEVRNTKLTSDNAPIERKKSQKLFGICIQSDLKWNHKTSSTVNTERRRLYFLKVCKEIWYANNRFNRCCSVIRSGLEYGHTLWYGDMWRYTRDPKTGAKNYCPYIQLRGNSCIIQSTSSKWETG